MEDALERMAAAVRKLRGVEIVRAPTPPALPVPKVAPPRMTLKHLFALAASRRGPGPAEPRIISEICEICGLRFPDERR